MARMGYSGLPMFMRFSLVFNAVREGLRYHVKLLLWKNLPGDVIAFNSQCRSTAGWNGRAKGRGDGSGLVGKYGYVVVVVRDGQNFLAVRPNRDLGADEEGQVPGRIGQRDNKLLFACRFRNLCGHIELSPRHAIERRHVRPLPQAGLELQIVLS